VLHLPLLGKNQFNLNVFLLINMKMLKSISLAVMIIVKIVLEDKVLRGKYNKLENNLK